MNEYLLKRMFGSREIAEQKLRKKLDTIMEKYPDLGAYGFSDDPNKVCREALVKDFDRFVETFFWLITRISKTKSINKRYTSYGIKHMVEEQIGYITNGTFIAAALAAEFDMERCDESSPNAFFNISHKAVDVQANIRMSW